MGASDVGAPRQPRSSTATADRSVHNERSKGRSKKMSQLGPKTHLASSRGVPQNCRPSVGDVLSRPLAFAGQKGENAFLMQCRCSTLLVCAGQGSQVVRQPIFHRPRRSFRIPLAAACAGGACRPFLRLSPGSAESRGSLVAFAGALFVARVSARIQIHCKCIGKLQTFS